MGSLDSKRPGRPELQCSSIRSTSGIFRGSGMQQGLGDGRELVKQGSPVK